MNRQSDTFQPENDFRYSRMGWGSWIAMNVAVWIVLGVAAALSGFMMQSSSGMQFMALALSSTFTLVSLWDRLMTSQNT